MLPPTDSISRAMSSAERRAVPLSSSLPVNWVTPLLSAVSASTPPWNTARNSTNGRRWSSFTSRRRPLAQLELLDRRARAKSRRATAGLGAVPVGQQRVERAVLRREVCAGDALQVGGRDALDGGQVALGEIQVIGREPAAAQVLRLALHGLARGERGGDELLHRLAQFVRGDRGRPSSSRLRPAWRRARRRTCPASTMALMPNRPGSPGL